jgi:hypothetical protein
MDPRSEQWSIRPTAGEEMPQGRALDEEGQPPAGTVWPPANFGAWPGTRTAALVFDGILLGVVVLVLAVPLLRRRAAGCPTSSNLCCLLVTGVVVGVVGGMWLHLVPCLWWTCDWGPYDGEGVRGAIWIVGSIVLTLLTCGLLGRQRAKRQRGTAGGARAAASGIRETGPV